MSDYGVLTAPDAVRLERILPGPPERVWAYLTDADKRSTWFGGGVMDLQVGATCRLEFHHENLSHEPTPERFQSAECASMDIQITACDPPRLLAYIWGAGNPAASEVRFELSQEGADTRLVLTHFRLANREEMLSVSAGWHTHVDILSDRLNDVEPRGFWTNYLRLEAEYGTRFPER
jgi:uncharacterized protein YndB with AHSA1/START domain